MGRAGHGHLGEIDHPANIAAQRIDAGEIAPAALERIVAELHAGPMTPNRLRDAGSDGPYGPSAMLAQVLSGSVIGWKLLYGD